jgi:multiple sugar transport system ATP-binding protein
MSALSPRFSTSATSPRTRLSSPAAAAGAEVAVGIRPEHVVQIASGAAAAAGELSRVRGEVALVENLGESALIYLRVPDSDGLTLCRIEGASLVKEGETLDIGMPAGALHLFDADGVAFPRTVDALPGASIATRRAS